MKRKLQNGVKKDIDNNIFKTKADNKEFVLIVRYALTNPNKINKVELKIGDLVRKLIHNQ